MITEDKTPMRQKLKQAGHHCRFALSKLLKYTGYTALTLLIVISILSAVLQFYIFPNINQYKNRIETIATQQLGAPVHIADIQAHWRGLHPTIRLSDVTITNGQKDGLVLPEVSASISWKSLINWQVQFAHLQFVRPDMTIHRFSDGQLSIGGIQLPHQHNHDDAGLNWLLNQHHIEIKQGTLRWLDDMRQAPLLTLNDVSINFTDSVGRYHLQIDAHPDLPQVSPIHVNIQFARSWRTLLSKESPYEDLSQWDSDIHLAIPQIDLSVWKQYVDLPVKVTQGTGEVYADLHIDHAKVTSFSAKLNVSNVKLQWQPTLAPLDLKTFRGEITANETYSGYFKNSFLGIGKLGHTMSMKHVYVQLAQGDELASDYITEHYWPETRSAQEKTELQFASLNLKTLALLAKSLPLPASQRQMLQDLKPSGELSDFSIGWEGNYPDISHYHLKGKFNDLALAALPFRAAVAKTSTHPAIAARLAMPGIQHMSGTIDTTETGGQVTIASNNAVIEVPDYIPDDELAFNEFDFSSSWKIAADNQVDIDLHRFNFKLDDISGSVSGQQKISILHPKDSWINLEGHFTDIDVKDMSHYLPKAMDEDVKAWLLGALVKGHVPEVNVNVQGKLSDFPFTQKNGEFTVSGQFKDATMNYYPGHYLPNKSLPEWPLLENIDGDFTIEGTQLTIHAKDGETNKVSVPKVTAVIDDLSSANTTLHIDGYGEGSMQNMLSYVENSPVNGWLEGFTTGATAQGNGKIHLQFQLPINDPEATKVQGTVTFLKNNVQLFQYLPEVDSVTGELHFNEKGFSLNQVKGQVLGQPLTVAGGTQDDGATAVTIRGSVEANGLRRQWGNSMFKPILDQLNGKTDFTTYVTHQNGKTEVKVNSSLQGIDSQLPVPFTKKAESVLPVTFILQDLPSSDPLLLKDQMSVKLGDILDVMYHRQKVVDDNDWHVVNGGIGIYHAAPEPDSGVTVFTDMPKINMDAWLKYRSAVEQHLSGTDQTGANSMAQYSPSTVIVRTPELQMNQRTFDDVILAASREQNSWHANVRSNQVEGYLSWNEPKNANDLGHVVARLTRLIIPKSEATYIEKASETGRYTKQDMPTLDIEADDFELYGMKLGQLSLKASTKDTGSGQDWLINQLQLTNADGHLQAEGSWRLSGNQSQTHLTYALDVKDAGKLLSRLDFPKTIAGGKGRLDGDITWTGSPFALDIPSMKGSMALEMENGQFLQIEPGAARLLGVLSLQSLPRRLALDFKDVFSSGMAFDKVNGNALINHGVLSTDSLHMHSVAVDVNLKGDVDLDHETQQLLVTVIPDVSLTAASVAVMAVNPAIGLGTLFTQWVLNKSIKKSLTYYYDITGSWADPVVVKRENNQTQDKK